MGVIVDVLVAQTSDAQAIINDFEGSKFKYQCMNGFTIDKFASLLGVFENSSSETSLIRNFRVLYSEEDSDAVVCLIPQKLTNRIALLSTSEISKLAKLLSDRATFSDMYVSDIKSWLVNLNKLSKRAIKNDLSLLYRASP